MHALPTLYKARGLALKRPVCAICIDRTPSRRNAAAVTSHER
jgi:hypothetical protein